MAEKVYRFLELEDLPIQFREEVAAGIKSKLIKATHEEKTGKTRIWGGDLEWYLSGRTHDIKFTQ